MDEAVMKKGLTELSQAITSVPVSAPQPTAGGIYQPDPRAPQSVEEFLDFLRLQVKYLMFDLEATRRENRYLRQLLENRPQPGREDSQDGPSL